MIILVILGIAIMALAIWVIRNNKRMSRGRAIHAYVNGCEAGSKNILGVDIPVFTLTLSIPTSYGTKEMPFEFNTPKDIGDTIEVFYDEEKDRLQLAKDVKLNQGNGPKILLLVGVIMTLFGAFGIWSDVTGNNEFFGKVCAYGTCILFIFVGIYMIFIKPAKLNKRMDKCIVTEGTVVNYVEHYSKNSDGRRRKMYAALYSYMYKGVELFYESTFRSSSMGSKPIGTKVTIVVDTESNRVYCKEDEASGKKMSLLFLAIGVGVMILLMVTGK